MEKVQGVKGRPRKTEGEFDSVIKDPLFQEYHIKITRDCYIIMHTNKFGKEKEVAYCTTVDSSISSILRKIAREKMIRPNEVYTLQSYITEYKELVNSLNKQFYNE